MIKHSDPQDTYNSKININSILNLYLINEKELFILYCRSIWKDLVKRSDNFDKGINKLTFDDYFPLSGIISERVFCLFDVDGDSYLSKEEFIEGMSTLFCKSYESLLLFIFKIYDFNSDGRITKNDILNVMQYVNKNEKSLFFTL